MQPNSPVFFPMKRKHESPTPLCPVHSKPMKRLPTLPPLTIGRGVTEWKIKLRREFNAVLRYRCPVEGCPYCAVVEVPE